MPESENAVPDTLAQVEESSAAIWARRLSLVAIYGTPLLVLLLVARQGGPLLWSYVLIAPLSLYWYWRTIAFGRVLGVNESPPGALIAVRGRTRFLTFDELESWSAGPFEPLGARRMWLVLKRRASPWGAPWRIVVYSDASSSLLERVRDYWKTRSAA